MRALLRNHLFHFSRSPAPTLLLRLQACEFSSSSSTSAPNHSRDVRVSVWWDFQSCAVPDDVEASKVAPAIEKAVRANGIKGPLHITAFGNPHVLPKSNQEALASTGIQIIPIPGGGTKSVNILADIMFWVIKNPPPAHLFLISGDGDFGCILHRLRMNNYNILLATTRKAPGVLFSAATIMWQWPSLLKGKILIGKHFNHPPDGPFGSWYRNLEVPLKNKISKTKTSSLKTRSENSSDIDSVKSEYASCKPVEKHTASGNCDVENDHTTMENNGTGNYELGNFKVKKKFESPTTKEVDEVCFTPFSSPVKDSLIGRTFGRIAETYNTRPSFFRWIRSWWPIWKSNAKSDDLAAHQNKVVSHLEDSKSEMNLTVSHFEEPKLSELVQNVLHSRKPELFSGGFFWNDLKSFIFSPKGSLLISQSKTREDIAHKLQNDGPLVLRSLTQKDIIQLVELLTAEKKWLVEIPSHGANGLRSVFMIRASQFKFSNSFEDDVKKQKQSFPHTRVDATSTEMKYTKRSRNDVLEDLHTLVSEILRDYSQGYNICSFRRLFVDRYGYPLDMQKLGHKKLSSLLQVMPGVKLESTYIFPCGPDGETSIRKIQITNASHAVLRSDGELSVTLPKDNNRHWRN